MTRAELIERLEKAECADRELDADIDIFLFGGETVWNMANYTMEMYPASRRASKNHVGGFANEHVPLYTASLDAAIALVERCTGENWQIQKMDEGDPVQWYDAMLGEEWCQHKSAPPALLICLFRALQAKEGNDV